MFSDEEEEEPGEGAGDRAGPPSYANEFDDFIEEDEFSDEERRREEEREIRSSHHAQNRMPKALSSQLTGIDEEKLGEIYEVFGDGEEYDWALEGEDEAELDYASDEGGEKGPPELKDVFEPGELKARLLTDEDNAIRTTDMPERYQLLRQALKSDYDLDDEDFKSEVTWISEKLESDKKHFFVAKPFLRQPFQKAVRRVLEFISKDSLEVPFIWQHRKDYLFYTYETATNSNKAKNEEDGDEEEKPQTGKMTSDLLLNRDDLWRIVHLDIEYHGMLEKRKALTNMYSALDVYDSLYEELLPNTSSLVGYQDLMDFVQFRYSAQIKDIQINSDKPNKRHSRFGRFERIRQGKIYGLVQAFGMTAEDLGENIEANQRLNFAEDPAQLPETMAREYTQPDEEGNPSFYQEPSQALEDAQQMLAEEIFYDPKVRKAVREKFWSDAKVDIVLTDKGHKKIDETSPYYDFKYAINRTFAELRLRPELYLRMLLAESEGLVVVRVSYPDYKTTLFEELLRLLLSDNVSDIASAWNEARRAVFKNASRKIVPLICRNIKEELKQDCTRSLYFEVRKLFGDKLNQAPYKPPGYVAGTTARVLTISGGMCEFGRDAILAVMVDEDGNVVDNAKLDDPRHEDFKTKLVKLIEDQTPDVVGIAGFTVNSSKLYDIVKKIIEDEKLTPGGDAGDTQLGLVWVQDEVARLFQNSKQGIAEFSEQPPLLRYCIALARYVQSPMLEYAALGREISAIHIHPFQHLLPKEEFNDAIDTTFVDYVNLVGVDVNEAVRNSYIGNLMQYVSGLGPRKASGILQGIQSKGGFLKNRGDLVTEEITARIIFMNCAAFLKIPYDDHSLKSQEIELLDATRIHPEDYELGKKMAADALELDEEDFAGYESSGGVVAQLLHEGPEKLNELILVDYAEELRKKFNQRKRETLEMIKAELLNHFGEQRAPLRELSEMQVFTMLTGETKTSLHPGVITPVNIRKIATGFAIGRLPSGVDANISLPERRNDIQYGFTVQSLVKSVNYAKFTCELSVNQSEIERALEQTKRTHQDSRKWNFTAEENDRARLLRKTQDEKKTRRIIKHPLFRVMNSRQAEEYLAGKPRGELVIRPSSRGTDHIAITWKVGENMFQHLDVLEMEKDNEYSLGKYLQVDGHRYTDLDELIIGHIQAMLRKVEEMINCDKFQNGGPSEVEKWITRYTEANGRSTYRYCYDHKRPGWFYLCFKTTPKAQMQLWHVQVIPNGFRMMKNDYGDVTALSNGFKTTFQNLQRQHSGGGHHRGGAYNHPPYSRSGYRR
jgi:transcription elongation factor SPT6